MAKRMRTRSTRKRVCRVPDLRDSFEGIVAGEIFAQLAEQRKDRNGNYLERKMSQSSSALKAMIAAATSQAMTWVKRELANSPIFLRSLVNWMSGITANGSWKLRTTWLRRSRGVTLFPPASPITRAEEMMGS